MNTLANLRDRLVLLFFGICFSLETFAQQPGDIHGDLVLVETEYVIPEHRDDYIQWAKELKAVAAKANFRSFLVDTEGDAFSYIFVLGKTFADYDAYQRDWEAFRKANASVDDLFKKYKHTFSSSKSEIWRHSPGQSYVPAGYQDPGNATYTRYYLATVKPGSGPDAAKILDEYKNLWTNNGIKTPYYIYWSVLGPVNGTVSIIENHKDQQAWIDHRKEVFSKIGEARLIDLDKRWRALIVHESESEGEPRVDLSHFKK